MSRILSLAGAFVVSGCVAVAAGAGAGGAIYLSDRGVESVVKADVSHTEAAARKAFQDLGISENKVKTEQDAGIEKRQLEGSTSDREVTVTIRSEGNGAHVEVIAKKSSVTWDKDFAKRVMEKIVAQST